MNCEKSITVSKGQWVAMQILVVVSIWISCIVMCWAAGVNEKIDAGSAALRELVFRCGEIRRELDKCRNDSVKYTDTLRRDINNVLSEQLNYRENSSEGK